MADGFLASLERELDLVLIPGGRPGMDTLGKSAALVEIVKRQQKREKWYCASSAASAVVLGANKLVENESVTTYPGFDYLLTRKDKLSLKLKQQVAVSGKCSMMRDKSWE